MRAVNLLPRDERGSRFDAGRLPLFLAAGAIVAVTAGSVLLTQSASGAASEHGAELAAVEATIAQLPRPTDAGVGQQVFVQERRDRVAALSAALAGRVSFDRVLRDISFVFPEDAWLTQFEATAPLPSVAAGPEGVAPPLQSSTGVQAVTIQGATFTHDSVAVVLSRLSVVPTLTNVRLSATGLVEPEAGRQGEDGLSTTTTRRGRPFVTFVVTAALKAEGGP